MSNGFIIVDGPRGSGKTTIANEIVENLKGNGFDSEYFKKGERSSYDEMSNMSTHLFAFTMTPKIWVVDRFHLTEMVMSTIHHREHFSKLLEGCLKITDEVKKSKGTQFFISADLDVIESRLIARGTRGWDIPKDKFVVWENYSRTLKFNFIRNNSNNIEDVKQVADKIVGVHLKGLKIR